MSLKMKKPTVDSNSAKTARGEQTKEKILIAAEKIIGSKGYYNTSIVEITQEAGVAQGTFYLYFPNKLTVYRELVMNLSHGFRREIELAIAEQGGKTRKEAETIGFKTFFAYVKQHKNLYRIVLEAEFVDPEIYRWYYRRLADGYVAGLQQALAKNEIKDVDLETAAFMLMGIGEFVGMRWILWEEQPLSEKVLDTVLEIIFYGILKEGKK